MIIVFFHMLYLIGKMVYDNYRCTRRKDSNDSAEKPCVPAAHTGQCQHATDPFAVYEEDEDNGPRAPRFSPPAYIQRYGAVGKVLCDPLYQGKIKKVVDFGCSELGFVMHLKNTPGIEEILCIDVDRDTLERYKDKAIPLTADFLQNRPSPLTIHVLEGSVTHMDKRLANTDAVVAIELIEHLYPETLMDFPYNIFGYMKPLVVALTTPNADFNVLFPRMKSEFRHWDHKFEWTREQFEDWAKNITSRYPEYDVKFEGICPGPPGTEELGCCSQMAIFTKVRTSQIEVVYGLEGLLKTVTCQEYPYCIDNRSDEQKILDEASYYIRRFSHNNSECDEEYPLQSLLHNLEKFYITSETLREILTNGGWVVLDRNDGPVIQCPALSTFSDYNDEIDIDDIADHDGWLPVFPDLEGYEAGSDTWDRGAGERSDEECWDDDYEIPTPPELSRNEHDRIDLSEDVGELASSLLMNNEIMDIDGTELPNLSSVSSVSESVPLRRLSPSLEDMRLNMNLGSLENLHNADNQNSSFESDDEAVTVSSSSNGQTKMMNRPSNIIKNPNVANISYETSDTVELASMCSMYLESSRNDEREACPQNISNPNFDCTFLERSFEDSMNSRSPAPADATASQLSVRLPSTSACIRKNDEASQLVSSPRAALALWQHEDQKLSSNDNADGPLKISSESSLRSTSTPSSSSSTSFRTVKRWYPPEVKSMYRNNDAAQLKGGNDTSDISKDEVTLQTAEISQSNSFVVDERNLRTSRRLEMLGNCSNWSTNPSSNVDPIRAVEESAGVLTDKSSAIKNEEAGLSSENYEYAEAKPATPETPPNSWSPEIMDSGYPNSSSTQDMTPECDLSSIAHDRMSDSESPSVAEAPRLGFHDHVEVENGDLANNNRDGEGNNMMAENDLDEDLQPFIDVLENDIENENDIYALENGFPMWLLRILERGNAAARQAVPEARGPEIQADMHAVGDPGMPELDEGFDGTSSENDSEEEDEDDDENVDEISTESSEVTVDWNISGDHC